ncbi:MAG: BREX-1 system phosphatase PglZ type A, partial [Candidatus Eisenbacteria sp.]|nr:BREX-1 system phosphatase PglZ type A [Candidatus Eisenbacteria bacterium]
RFEVIQTEAVGERRKPITLRAAVYDGARAVTSVETITFDSTSDRIEERKKSIRFELRTGTYDKTTPYRLVLRDVESDAEVQSVPVVIDRSFDDDF